MSKRKPKTNKGIDRIPKELKTLKVDPGFSLGKKRRPKKAMTDYRKNVADLAGKYPVRSMRDAINVFCAMTGGGKTLSVLRLAARAAVHFDLKRIVFASPFILLTDQAEKAISAQIDDSVAAVVKTHSKTHHNPTERRTAKSLGYDVTICTVRKLEMALCGADNHQWKAHQNLKETLIVVDDASQYLTAETAPVFMRLLDNAREAGAVVILSSGSLPDYGAVSKEPKIGEYIPKDIRIKRIGEKVDGYEKLANRAKVKTHESLGLVDITRIMKEAEGPQLIICETVAKSIKIFHHLKMKMRGTKMYLLNSRQSPANRKKLTFEVERALGKENPEKIIVVSTSVAQCGWDVSFAGGINDLFSYSGALEHLGRINRGFEYGQACTLHVGPISIDGLGQNHSVNGSRVAAIFTMNHLVDGKPLGICTAGTTLALIRELLYDGGKMLGKADILLNYADKGRFKELDSALKKRFHQRLQCPFLPSKDALPKALKALGEKLRKLGIRHQFVKNKYLQLEGGDNTKTPKEILKLVEEVLEEYAERMDKKEAESLEDKLVPLHIQFNGAEEETEYLILIMAPKKKR